MQKTSVCHCREKIFKTGHSAEGVWNKRKLFLILNNSLILSRSTKLLHVLQMLIAESIIVLLLRVTVLV